MRTLEPLISMISAFSYVSVSSETNIIHLWRHQDTLRNPRKSKTVSKNMIWGSSRLGFFMFGYVCPIHLVLGNLCFWEFDTLELLNFEMLQFWNCDILKFSNVETSNFETLIPRNFFIVKSWNPQHSSTCRRPPLPPPKDVCTNIIALIVFSMIVKKGPRPP